MFRTSLALLLAVSVAFPAQAFMASNDLIVEGRSPDSFEVPYRGLSGASDFWCAAGDYVVRELGLSPATRIYRTSSPPRRSGAGMTFSLSSEGAQRTGLIMIGNRRSVMAAHARQLCDRPDPLDD